MQPLLKRPGYRLYAAESPEARALLGEQGLGPADLDRALARLERVDGTAVRTIVGINEDGVFGTGREGWRPDLPDACHESFIPLLWLKVHELLDRVPEGSTARFSAGRSPGWRHCLPARKLSEVTVMDTDQLEHDMNELCHEWMHGKPPTDGVFGTVQAAARVFIFQALSAWSVLKATGQTEQLAPDFQAWMRSILEGEEPHVRRISSVKVTIPKH